jgi:hypothetical protein
MTTVARRNLSITRDHSQICPPDIGNSGVLHVTGQVVSPDRHHVGGQDRGRQREATRSWHVDMPHRGPEAVMSVHSITNSAPCERG